MEDIENQIVEITYKQWQQMNADIKGLTTSLIFVSLFFVGIIFALMFAVYTDSHALTKRIKDLEDTSVFLCKDCMLRNSKK